MDVWGLCMERLSAELPQEEVHTWLKPLHARMHEDNLRLYAPNAFVLEEVRDHHLPRIRELARHFGGISGVDLAIGAGPVAPRPDAIAKPATTTPSGVAAEPFQSNLDPYYHFENFVEGRSNQLARAAALMSARAPGAREHNPLLLYGGTGLGKTHLMLAAGNEIHRVNPAARVLYMRSNEFYSEFVAALKESRVDRFKRRFQQVDTLLIDDIQFFAGKDRTQEEFFHTFNMLLAGKQQLILTSDRYPKEVEGLEPRLKSRLNSGLSVAIDPPDFETRALIVLAKARERGAEVPEEVAMLIAKRMHSNVRELEGALNSLVARANLLAQPITTEFAFDTLRDLFRSQQAVISIPNIQKVVTDYYDLPLRMMLSDTKKRTITRARQMAMAMARELTDRSLPEIGEAFGRDHTTVINACKVIRKLVESDAKIHEDWEKLMRKLTE
ncbi:chromosomal replication initiator protein DnaA [Lysobacter pythonis]|uniref:Chromosomal replication initiator protein DnaA n=1 Tax=Solilutibacter pythonis TaxID=2483112 RepID=A0A3M2I6I9_9GAMM|nr:chromosomal replication initiator protein DnaA [Lysobacter pythonis]RMH93894.1 chromosomal replication initiator protein DnaA [Lysobacter pythonis]